jgi:hypothetical protein
MGQRSSLVRKKKGWGERRIRGERKMLSKREESER